MAAPGVFDEDFLLDTELARALYHRYAAPEPILDFHCHLSPAEIADDHRFRSLTELWLDGDHYKWRAMRTNGVPEVFCTGAGSDFEKFVAWAETVPKTLRNPLFHWTHLELKRAFGIARFLDGGSARHVYDVANLSLGQAGFGARALLVKAGVIAVCTSDDPADSLEHHAAHAQSAAAEELALYPTFRPDAALAVERPEGFRSWLERLRDVTGLPVSTYDDLLAALEQRHTYFHAHGCRASDHGLERAYAEDYSLTEVRTSFTTAASGSPVLGVAADHYRSALLHELSLMDHGRGWVQQFHLGAQRDNNSRLLAALGQNSGFDSIGDHEQARPLAAFLDRLDQTNQLAKTVLYNSNPRDNELFATMLGNYQDGSVPGKMQLGSAWWFLDQKGGIERQLDALSSLGLLARFVGMVTDSRSVLSTSRHEYFRRILCGLLGREAAQGLLPSDEAWLGGLVRDVCFRNARDYFGLALPGSAA
jgi:glucuronate isomerase